MARLGGVTTATIAMLAVVGGLLFVGGPVAVSAGPSSVTDAPYPQPTDQATTTTEPAAPSSSEPPSTTPSTAPPSSASTTTTTVADVGPPPLPTSVTPGAVEVGPSGFATIAGTCPVVDGSPLGPVEVWEVGATITSVATGITARSWSYDWQAPDVAGPLVLQVWCGDPGAYAGGYPAELQIVVDFVAQGGPTTTTVASSTDDPATELDVDTLPGTR